MPVTIQLGNKSPAKPLSERLKASAKPRDVFDASCAPLMERCKELLQTSIGEEQASNCIAMRKGLVDIILEAYNQHHPLVLRPDDVWVAILTQFSLYVNAHAGELRSSFVKHEGKEELNITTSGTRHTVDFGNLAKIMTSLIHEKVVDPSLRDWILPNFSTTTPTDTVVCAISMMSTLSQYFEFSITLLCGIPSVTLLGRKSDWEALLSKIPKLAEYGSEPSLWADILQPFLSRFVSAFDGEVDKAFWERIAHRTPTGSGPTYLSGWITAFSVWNQDGKWLDPTCVSRDKTSGEPPRGIIQHEETSAERRFNITPKDLRKSDFTIDGRSYPIVDSAKVPAGHCDVPVKLDDNGEEMMTTMVAGILAAEVYGDKQDALKPLPGWFIYVGEDADAQMVAHD